MRATRAMTSKKAKDVLYDSGFSTQRVSDAQKVLCRVMIVGVRLSNVWIARKEPPAPWEGTGLKAFGSAEMARVMAELNADPARVYIWRRVTLSRKEAGGCQISLDAARGSTAVLGEHHEVGLGG